MLAASAGSWLTARCPECEEIPQGTRAEVVVVAEGTHAHVMMGGFVVLGCEGYWVINPAVLGLDTRNSWHGGDGEDPPPARPAPLPQHNRPDGRWCRWSGCMTTNPRGWCPSRCQAPQDTL